MDLKLSNSQKQSHYQQNDKMNSSSQGINEMQSNHLYQINYLTLPKDINDKKYVLDSKN